MFFFRNIYIYIYFLYDLINVLNLLFDGFFKNYFILTFSDLINVLNLLFDVFFSFPVLVRLGLM